MAEEEPAPLLAMDESESAAPPPLLAEPESAAPPPLLAEPESAAAAAAAAPPAPPDVSLLDLGAALAPSDGNGDGDGDGDGDGAGPGPSSSGAHLDDLAEALAEEQPHFPEEAAEWGDAEAALLGAATEPAPDANPPDAEHEQARLLEGMGFPAALCWEAVALHALDTDAAVAWMLAAQTGDPPPEVSLLDHVPCTPPPPYLEPGVPLSVPAGDAPPPAKARGGPAKQPQPGGGGFFSGFAAPKLATFTAATENLGQSASTKLKGTGQWFGRVTADTGSKTAALLAGAGSSLKENMSTVATKARASPAFQSAFARKAATGDAPEPSAGAPAGPAAPLSMFGAELQALCASEAARAPVPQLVQACCHVLHTVGLETEGLFRLEGRAATQEALMAHFDGGRASAPLLPEGTDAVDVASLLKRYLRSLPEPLLTFALYDKVVVAGHSIPALIREDLASLPPANWATLRLVTALLHAVHANAETNRMNARNLGLVLAPTLVWPPPPAQAAARPEADMEALQKRARDVPAVAIVVQHLIECHEDIFNPPAPPFPPP